MKNLLTILLLFLVHFVNGQTPNLKGTVTDYETGEVIMFVTVVIYQNDTLIQKTQTDFDGKYKLGSVKAGTYDVEFSYLTHHTKKVSGVVIFKNKTIMLNIKMNQGVVFDCPVYISPPSLYEADNLTQGTTFFSKEIQRSPHKN
ncbi:MAG: carboxypeptidase-like regulatory domain-containing protein [Saprospiraceae bacterium]